MTAPASIDSRGALGLPPATLANLLKATSAPVALLDVGGEGRYPLGLNVNPATFGMDGRLIPHRIDGRCEALPVGDHLAGEVVVENAPISPKAAAEMARVVSPGGRVTAVSPADYAFGDVNAHMGLITEVGGPWYAESIRTNEGTTVARTVVASPGPTVNPAQPKAWKDGMPRSYSDAVRELGTEVADLEYRPEEAAALTTPDLPDDTPAADKTITLKPLTFGL